MQLPPWALVVYQLVVVGGGGWWLSWTDRHAPEPPASVFDQDPEQVGE